MRQRPGNAWPATMRIFRSLIPTDCVPGFWLDSEKMGATSLKQRARIKHGSNRVIRGGSWDNDAQNARVANRNDDEPGNRNANQGFRLASSARGPRYGEEPKARQGPNPMLYGPPDCAQVLTRSSSGARL